MPAVTLLCALSSTLSHPQMSCPTPHSSPRAPPLSRSLNLTHLFSVCLTGSGSWLNVQMLTQQCLPLTCPWCRETAPGGEGGGQGPGVGAGSRGTGGGGDLTHRSFPKDIQVSVCVKEGHQHVQPSPCQVCAVEPCPYTELPGQPSHGSLWGFTSEVFRVAVLCGAPRRRLPLQLSGVREGSMGSCLLFGPLVMSACLQVAARPAAPGRQHGLCCVSFPWLLP